MIPNIYIHEQLRVEHTKELQYASEQQQLLKQLPRIRFQEVHQASAYLGNFLVVLGTRLKQFGSSEKPAASA